MIVSHFDRLSSGNGIAVIPSCQGERWAGMYVPKHFAESRPEVLHGFIRSRPFGTLITMTARGLEASHIPFVLKSNPAPFGTLQGHLAGEFAMGGFYAQCRGTGHFQRPGCVHHPIVVPDET